MWYPRAFVVVRTAVVERPSQWFGGKRSPSKNGRSCSVCSGEFAFANISGLCRSVGVRVLSPALCLQHSVRTDGMTICCLLLSPVVVSCVSAGEGVTKLASNEMLYEGHVSLTW